MADTWRQVRMRGEVYDRVAAVAEKDGRSVANMLERIVLAVLDGAERGNGYPVSTAGVACDVKSTIDWVRDFS